MRHDVPSPASCPMNAHPLVILLFTSLSFPYIRTFCFCLRDLIMRVPVLFFWRPHGSRSSGQPIVHFKVCDLLTALWWVPLLGVMGRLGVRLETAGFAGVYSGSLFFFVSFLLALDEGKGGGQSEKRGGCHSTQRITFANARPAVSAGLHIRTPTCIQESPLLTRGKQAT